MRKRSKALTTIAACALVGGTLAGTAGATSPPDSGGGSGAAVVGAGAGRGTDSGIAGADLSGTTVTLSGVEGGDVEGASLQAALDQFATANNMTITYTGSRGFEGEVGTAIQGGSPPDIALFPQPGRVAQYAASGDALQIPDDVLASVSQVWGSSWMALANVDGKQFGLPIKADLKSLVWYEPARFAEYGYEVPTTFDDFTALVAQMVSDGHTPLCVGIGSQDATGWPFTDWVEELVLRNQGIGFYNDWVSHAIPFNSPEIVADFEQVMSLWAPDNVYAAGGSIVATAFGDNAQPLVDGDCMMHHQASFFAANLATAGATYGDGENQVNAFYFPANEGRPTLVGGINAEAFRDAPEVWAVMQYLGSAEYANARQTAQAAAAVAANGEGALSGFLTAAKGVDTSLFQPLEQTFLDILQNADPAGFDASDQMPAEVGSATGAAFWVDGTAFVNGDETAQQAADNIEAAWPAG